MKRSAADAIGCLNKALMEIAPTRPEREYQAALIKVLNDNGFKAGRHAVSVGQPDIYVAETDPPLLIEIKPSGDWKSAALAAAQLLIYCSDPNFGDARKIAIFGTDLQHPAVFASMFRKLGIDSLVAGKK